MSRTTQPPWYWTRSRQSCARWQLRASSPMLDHLRRQRRAHRRTGFSAGHRRRHSALRDELAPNSKIAVLSNGTRADRPEVHDALMMVDDNILKLDTVDPAFIQLLDQPVGPYDVEHQIETFASFDGHVIIQTIFLTGEYRGKSIDNTGEEYVGPWLAALERIRPQEATIYTVARETPIAGLTKAAPEVLDAIAARVQALGIPCQVSY